MVRFDYTKAQRGLKEIRAREARLGVPAGEALRDEIWVKYEGTEGTPPPPGTVLHIQRSFESGALVSTCPVSESWVVVEDSFPVDALAAGTWCETCIEEADGCLEAHVELILTTADVLDATEGGTLADIVEACDQLAQLPGNQQDSWYCVAPLYSLRIELTRRRLELEAADPERRADLVSTLHVSRINGLAAALWATPVAQQLLQALEGNRDEDEGLPPTAGSIAHQLSQRPADWDAQWVEEAARQALRITSRWNTVRDFTQLRDVPMSFLSTGSELLVTGAMDAWRTWRDECFQGAVKEWAESLRQVDDASGPVSLLVAQDVSETQSRFQEDLVTAAALWESWRDGQKVAVLLPEVYARMVAESCERAEVVTVPEEVLVSLRDSVETALALWDPSLGSLLSSAEQALEAARITTHQG